MQYILKKKKIVIDMFLNIIATAIPTFSLQILVMPLIASFIMGEDYGLLLTMISVLNVIPSTMGNALNNIRLIYGENSVDDGKTEDFNVILLVMTIINCALVGFFSWYYEKNITIVGLLLTLLASILWLFREYYIVVFRIKINYFYVLVCNIIMAIGFGVGLTVFRVIGYWQCVYIFGNLASLIFIVCKSNLWKEPIRTSIKFRTISWQAMLLVLSNILTRITVYADKLLIFPVLGGNAVSIYFAATVFGKIVSLAITPVSSVILSYLSKEKQKNDNVFNKTLLCSSIVSILGYFVCLLISRPILEIIYPQFVDEAMKYIIWTTASVVLIALLAVVNPFVLKFFDMKWQILINGGTAMVYIIISMLFLYYWGLIGFCLSTLLTNFTKLIFMLYIYKKCAVKEELI